MSHYPLPLLTFLRLLFIPCLVVIAINFGIFFLLYRSQLKGTFNPDRLPSAENAIKASSLFPLHLVRACHRCAIVCDRVCPPVPSLDRRCGRSFAARAGALYWKRTTLVEAGKGISWSIFGFIAGMFIVVRAIEDTGLTVKFGNLLLRLSGGSSFGAVMVGTFGSALGTNLINNVPMAVVMNSALGSVQTCGPRDPEWLCRRHHLWLRPRTKPDHRRIHGHDSMAAHPA